ncbi:MAG TPA: CoA transferase, partial [Mycobacterium sp.]|nr:CoA transferase [Mycobacterium sp.]
LRVANRDALCTLLEPALKAEGADHWYTKLTAADVPAGPINDLSEAFAFARGLGIEATVTVPDSQTPQVANPVTLSATPVTYRNGPPRLGDWS